MVVVPADVAVAEPEASIVATEPIVLLHAPPTVPVGSLNSVEEPAQKTKVPAIVPATDGMLTVTILVATAVPQLLVTV